MDTKGVIKAIQELHQGTTFKVTNDHYELIDKDKDCVYRIARKINMTREKGLNILKEAGDAYWPQWIFDMAEKRGFKTIKEGERLKFMVGDVVGLYIYQQTLKNKKAIKRYINILTRLVQALKL